MIQRSVDPEDGIIMVVSIGEATRADIDEHYDALRRMIAELRAEGRPVRVLSDQTRADWLSDELNQHIRSQIERTYLPGDRLALLLASPDRKLAVREVLGVTDYAVFDSRLAAEIWLMEPALRPPSSEGGN
jgi:hypothetical protein